MEGVSDEQRGARNYAWRGEKLTGARSHHGCGNYAGPPRGTRMETRAANLAVRSSWACHRDRETSEGFIVSSGGANISDPRGSHAGPGPMMVIASANWSHVKWEGQKRMPSQAIYAADASSSNGACRAIC